MYRLNRRRATAGVLGLMLAGGGLAAAPAAQAYGVLTLKVSCSAVKIHKSPSKSSTVVGIGYKGDKDRVDQFAFKVSEKVWYSRGTVTRRSDGKKVRGYAIYDCVNPYEVTPPPAYPKRP